MTKIETHAPLNQELTDEELSLVQGGSIGGFLTKLGNDIQDMMSTGHRTGHGNQGAPTNAACAAGVA